MEPLLIMHPFDILNLDNGARLIFTPCPGTKEASLQASLKTLQAAGADAVVTMMPDAELSEFKADALPVECNALGLAWFQLPVEDDCAPRGALCRRLCQPQDGAAGSPGGGPDPGHSLSWWLGSYRADGGHTAAGIGLCPRQGQDAGARAASQGADPGAPR